MIHVAVGTELQAVVPDARHQVIDGQVDSGSDIVLVHVAGGPGAHEQLGAVGRPFGVVDRLIAGNGKVVRFGERAGAAVDGEQPHALARGGNRQLPGSRTKRNISSGKRLRRYARVLGDRLSGHVIHQKISGAIPLGYYPIVTIISTGHHHQGVGSPSNAGVRRTGNRSDGSVLYVDRHRVAIDNSPFVYKHVILTDSVAKIIAGHGRHGYRLVGIGVAVKGLQQIALGIIDSGPTGVEQQFARHRVISYGAAPQPHGVGQRNAGVGQGIGARSERQAGGAHN